MLYKHFNIKKKNITEFYNLFDNLSILPFIKNESDNLIKFIKLF